MTQDLLFALWFMLPAAAANAAPLIGAKLPYLKKWQTPIDGGAKLGGKALLGSHKTWRGVVTGLVAALVTVLLQQWLVGQGNWAEGLLGDSSYLEHSGLLLAALFTLGALGGDAVESFFKRRVGVKSGRSWFPFDQIDYIVGTIITTLPIVVLSLRQYLFILLVWTSMHLIVNYFAWKAGLKKRPI